MKIAIALFCFLAAASAVNIKEHGVANKIVSIQERAFEAELLAMVERFRELVKNGDEELGIPVLDPFRSESVNMEWINGASDLFLKMLGVGMNGLSTFEVNKLSVNLLRFRLDYDFSLSLLELLAANYDLESHLNSFHLFGNGAARIGVTKIRISGYSTVSMTQMQMKEFKLVFAIDEFQSDIQGLLGGGDTSDFLNEVLSTLIPAFFEENQQRITDAIEEKVLEFVNGMLSGGGQPDLLSVIKGIDKRQIARLLKQHMTL